MKTVLVTGGSRGIGRSVVRRFKEAGWQVAFTYCTSEVEALALARETGALAIRADSACKEQIREAVAQVIRLLGTVDCLVNNAAISSFRLFTEITDEEWERFVSVNLTAPFLYTREVLPAMIQKKQGRIIQVSSVWGLVGASCEVHYSTTKAALIGMTKALAKELGPSGITVNAVAPGVIDTDMNRALGKEELADLAEQTPMGRIGTPEEVADAILYLASEQASFITGQVLNISGGFVI